MRTIDPSAAFNVKCLSRWGIYPIYYQVKAPLPCLQIETYGPALNGYAKLYPQARVQLRNLRGAQGR